MSQIQTMKKTVNQLRQEANIQRIPVSQACDDLMKYCNEHQKTDVLVTGMSPSDNPYRDIKGCVIIWKMYRYLHEFDLCNYRSVPPIEWMLKKYAIL